MSKPVSNAEIEDVLSSIRRLVSENAGTNRRDRSGAQAGDRLVLTPAFRVDDSASEAAEAPPGDEAAPDPAPPQAVDEPRTAGDGAGDGAGAEAEMDAAVAILAERLTAANIIPDHAAGAPSDTASPDVAAPGHAPEDAVAGAMAGAPGAQSLERRIAELEAAVDNTAGEWEPDGSEALDTPDRAIFHHRAARPDPGDAEAPAPEAAAEDGPDLAATETMDRAEEAAGRPEPVEGQEPAPGATEDTEATGDIGAGGDDAWEDVVFDRADDAQAFGGDDVDDAEVLEEESVIDEAILRDYVAQMVREELQGPIGERITHNVRRMVRREIARALALRDME